jgi:malonyl CoA-acyl carrier protein transacylase
VETIRLLAAEGVTKVYEVGPGAVLDGLARQIDPTGEVVKWDTV